MTESPTVLITGCSTGIGRATATRLANAGADVIATARNLDDIADLAEIGCQTLSLDVTSEESMATAVAAAQKRSGKIDVLVNNAGYSQSGAVEDIEMDDIRRQFETNVFGLIRMCQLVLPDMRQRRSGRIINIGSIGGRLTFPGGGIYHATKHAVEAISDAMRFELQDFGIKVVLIEPGLIRTEFAQTVTAEMDRPSRTNGAYDEFNTAVATSTLDAYQQPMLARFGGEPDTVAQVIAKVISSDRPKSRYLVTLSAHALVNQRRVMPDRMWDRFLRTQMSPPQPPTGA